MREINLSLDLFFLALFFKYSIVIGNFNRLIIIMIEYSGFWKKYSNYYKARKFITFFKYVFVTKIRYLLSIFIFNFLKLFYDIFSPLI